MGMTFAKLKLSNLKDPKIKEDGNFLIDSGAHYTVVPKDMVSKLNLKPSWQQDFELADGKIIKRNLGDCMIEYEDHRVPMQVVLGENEDAAILGVLTLEAMGLTLDPLARKIVL